ncbi:MAG TPA: hypothetical protein VIU12_24805 [Chryseolinea sp.]
MRPCVLFTATCSFFISCCPSGSPFDLNDTDRATVKMIAEFEHYQVLAVGIAGMHQGPAAVIVRNYGWNHDEILLDLQHIADNNALELPTSLNVHYGEILEELRQSSPEAFDNLYLYRASEELKKVVTDLHIEERGGAEFSVLALNAKMLSLVGRQLNAVDSVLYGK